MPNSCLNTGMFSILNTGVQGCSRPFEHGVFRGVHRARGVQLNYSKDVKVRNNKLGIDLIILLSIIDARI